MNRIALVTDSTSGIDAVLAAKSGVSVVAASYAFDEQRRLDGDEKSSELYDRMATTKEAPRPFGVSEAAFRASFESALKEAEGVLCILAPFGSNPSFTTACAAMLAIQFDVPDARIKVANAGIGSVGLGALILALAERVRGGSSLDDLLSALDELEPRSDSLFIPADTTWLDRAGVLAPLEDRLGPLEDRFPVVRVGTRITGIAATESAEKALEAAVGQVQKRAGSGPLRLLIGHANNPAGANTASETLRSACTVARLDIVELPVTHGAQLGPGAFGIGVCPAETEPEHA